jgi:hypothetical protein
MNANPVDYLSALGAHWSLVVPGLALLAAEAVVRTRASWRIAVDRRVPFAVRWPAALLVLAAAIPAASFSAWRADRSTIDAFMGCAPDVAWGPTLYEFDDRAGLGVAIGHATVTPRSDRAYGIAFEGRGDGVRSIWAEALDKRPLVQAERDASRLVRADGMAHYLYMPKGSVVVMVWAARPKEIRFAYSVECFDARQFRK